MDEAKLIRIAAAMQKMGKGLTVLAAEIRGTIEQVELFANTQPETKKENSIFSELKALFIDYYKNEMEISYHWQAKDAAALKRIIKKVNFNIKANDQGATDDMVSAVFNLILGSLKDVDKWVYDNLSVNILDSKLTQLLAKIKASGNGQSEYNKIKSKLKNI